MMEVFVLEKGHIMQELRTTLYVDDIYLALSILKQIWVFVYKMCFTNNGDDDYYVLIIFIIYY